MSDIAYSTFWHGPELSATEKACLATFVAAGHMVRLYSFKPVGDLPCGVEAHDAATVVDEKHIFSYIVNGKPSISHFSDYFRLSLFAREEAAWIDTDMVCLGAKMDWDPSKKLLGKEESGSICNALLHIPKNDPKLPQMIAACEAMRGVIAYGATGKDLLQKFYGKDALLEEAASPDIFYPVHYDDFWKVYLPEFREECEQLSRNAKTLHLWNNLVEECGIWKKFGPPKGSYLETVFDKAGVMGNFADIYPEKVMRRMVNNYLSRNGQEVGFVRLTRLIVPSILRTFERRILKKYDQDILRMQKSKSFLSIR